VRDNEKRLKLLRYDTGRLKDWLRERLRERQRERERLKRVLDELAEHNGKIWT
jgi:hypothetical protein